MDAGGRTTQETKSNNPCRVSKFDDDLLNIRRDGVIANQIKNGTNTAAASIINGNA